jgi:glutamate dehydrogenase (NADP+)
MVTGKALDWGGSHVRPEATGYGLIYYVEHMIKYAEGEGSKGFEGKKVVISGSGQVAQFAALKCMELGATVLSLSDSKGSLVVKDPSKPFTKEIIEKVYKIKYDRKELSSLGDEGGALEFHKGGERPWKLVDAYDVALPCATQNEVDKSDAEAAIKAGCKYVAEGSNMGVDAGGIGAFEKSRISKGKEGCWYGPGKAANAGGVATSALEMAQNSQRLTWKPEEVDEKLKDIMKIIYDNCFKTGKEYPAEGDSQKDLPSLVQGANIAGFKKVADAMFQHGDYF